MTSMAFSLTGVQKSYRHFELRGIHLALPTGCIMGFIGPNGAGKSTTIRILMGLVRQDAGQVEVLGRTMPSEQCRIKHDVGFVSEDMRLYPRATIRWHMGFVKSIYATWDERYAQELLVRFDLRPNQRVKGLSHGQAVKAVLLLALARHPKLLILDEPTTGLDPVVRHEVLSELTDVLRDEDRSVLISSHNTQDVEQISDIITFIHKGAVLESADKEAFLDRWRRVLFEVDPDTQISLPGECHVLSRNGRTCALTTGQYSDDTMSSLRAAGGSVLEVQRMTLEEIFLARIDIDRRPADMVGRSTGI